MDNKKYISWIENYNENELNFIFPKKSRVQR